jgi:WD40 repeat protein
MSARYTRLLAIVVGVAIVRISPALSQTPAHEPVALPQPGRILPPGAVARLGPARLLHRVAVTGLAFSADGKWLASGGGDGAVRVWDGGTLRKVHHLKGLVGSDARVLFSPDSSGLAGAATGGDPGIILWDVSSGKERWRSPDACRALAFSKDGKSLACGLNSGAVSLRDTGTGKELRRYEGLQEAVGHVAFLDGSQALAAVGKRRTLLLWDVASGKGLRKVTNPEVTADALCFSADCKTLVSQPSGAEILLLDVLEGKPARRLRSKANAGLEARPNAEYGDILGYSGALSADGKWLAVGATVDHMHLWDLSYGKDYSLVCDSPRRRIGAVAFSADGRSLASGGWDGVIQIWDVGGQGPALFFDYLIRRNGPGGKVDQLVFSPDGKRLVTGDLTLHLSLLWDADSGRALAVLPEGTISPDGRWLAQPPLEGKKDYTISTLTGGKDKRFVRLNSSYGIIASPDGKQLAGQELGGPAIRVLDAATGKELRRLVDPTSSLVPSSFSGDGKLLLGGPVEGKLSGFRVWELSSGKEIYRSTEPGGNHRLSPDGKLLAELGYPYEEKTPSPPRLVLRDLPSGKTRRLVLFPDVTITEGPIFAPAGNVLAVLGEEKGPHIYLLKVTAQEPLDMPVKSERIRAIVFSPDGRTLASAGHEGMVHLWEVATGRERHIFAGHTGQVGLLVFSGDGRRLASNSEDMSVLVWDLWAPVPPVAGPLTEKDLEGLWADLASPNAGRAFRAIQILAGAKEGVAFLGDRLRQAAPPVSARSIAGFIAELDSNSFAVRSKASAELEKLGEIAVPALSKALEKAPSLEARRRLEALVARCQVTRALAGEELRQVRALEALEHSQRAKARQVLQTLASGPADARLTLEAQAALRRLEK